MYKSLIDGHECTEHHYLVEFVVARKAKKLGLTLPSKFWNTDEWKKEYKLQVIAARSLLKIFSTDEILAGLRSKQGNWIYSLQNRSLVDIINTEKSSKERQEAVRSEIKKSIEVNFDNSNETVVKPTQRKKNNTLNKLEDIDAELQRNNF